ncbi:hypothetical protein ASD04_10245 [Devosia sp. Root436]|jgi:hypothetical protein|uniref:tripartite tricarboxylate transporter TctB family protein n=1 Tax=Devosia sp. Root436 TaxID=1736537 RepID=UPI000701DD28|nr:tripartite tricarboxylate transporter TctB family protein [Devosia sp. Root436]KQX38005.1 hypothetical protein ASD04_10245 [Devosia sp. Root436]
MAADRLIGAGLFILGVVMAWASTQIAAPMLGEGDPGPQVLPLVLGVVIAILGAMLSLRNPAVEVSTDAPLFDEADTATLIPPEPLLLRAIHAVNLLAYAVLFERLGFTLSTFIFLAIAIFLLGTRSLRGGVVAVLVAVLVSLVVGTGLKLGIGVPLPGVLFG